METTTVLHIGEIEYRITESNKDKQKLINKLISYSYLEKKLHSYIESYNYGNEIMYRMIYNN